MIDFYIILLSSSAPVFAAVIANPERKSDVVIIDAMKYTLLTVWDMAVSLRFFKSSS